MKKQFWRFWCQTLLFFLFFIPVQRLSANVFGRLYSLDVFDTSSVYHFFRFLKHNSESKQGLTVLSHSLDEVEKLFQLLTIAFLYGKDEKFLLYKPQFEVLGNFENTLANNPTGLFRRLHEKATFFHDYLEKKEEKISDHFGLSLLDRLSLLLCNTIITQNTLPLLIDSYKRFKQIDPRSVSTKSKWGSFVGRFMTFALGCCSGSCATYGVARTLFQSTYTCDHCKQGEIDESNVDENEIGEDVELLLDKESNEKDCDEDGEKSVSDEDDDESVKEEDIDDKNGGAGDVANHVDENVLDEHLLEEERTPFDVLLEAALSCREGDYSLLDRCLTQKISINCTNEEKKTVLHEIAGHKDGEMLDVMKALRARGALLRVVDKDGLLPMHYAACSGYFEILTWLHNQDPSMVALLQTWGATLEGETTLHALCKTFLRMPPIHKREKVENYKLVVQFLRAHDIDPFRLDAKRKRAIDYLNPSSLLRSAFKD